MSGNHSHPLLRTLFLACLFLVTLPLNTRGATDPAENIPWNLYADRIQTLDGGEITEARGNVFLFQGDNQLQADYAKYYKSTQWLYLEGNITAKWDGDFLEAESAEFDLGNRVGWLTNGQVFIEANHVYVKGEKIHKTGDNTYTFTQATVTSCDGTRPAWSLKTSSGDVTIDGYARLWNPRLQIKGQPVLYAPYMVMPVKTKRQSGFLLPQLEVSKQLGTHINLPYYQVIDEESDLTLYENYMSKRGLMQGIEFRSTPDLDTKMLVRFDWLKDHQAYEDGEYTSDVWQRPHQDRYWLRGKFDGYLLSPQWTTKLDLDLVSDYQYLREFNDGLSGFDQSRKDFLQEFGRDIDDDDDYLRENILAVSRSWANMGLEFRLEYTQNLYYFNDSTDYDSAKNPTLQRLPEINFNVYKHQLASTMFEWEATSQYTYFWREYGTKGSRLDIHPHISLPLRTQYGTIIPKVGWRETLYAVDRFENTGSTVDTTDKYPVRGLPDASVELSTNLFRIYSLPDLPVNDKDHLGESVWSKIKHSVTPEIEYSWIPNTLQDQKKNPQFDSDDAIYPESNLTYSLVNLLTRKRMTVVNDPATQGNSTTTKADYLDFLRFKLEQSYDFREAARTEDTDLYPTRPFSDIEAELTIFPRKYLSLTSTSWYSPYLNRITEHEHTARIFLDDLASAYCGLDFVDREQEYPYKTNYLGTGDRSRILTLGGDVALPRNWFLAVDYKADLEDGQDLDRKMTLTYKHQCFTFECFLSKTDTDEKIAVMITLYNLGSMGG
ncbi:LPS-assembly protein LptD [Desulfoplanes formicivorans]|uniref:LPS-assembly protein LptD n=1 Tax=Desulfoplanes formicivorans TaxID=1592317 RepID=UPI0015B4A7DF|nr:LPS assembly protein LptD [Desulfoplanes formicivorans]